MMQQAQADWEELRSKPPQEPQVGPAQEAALGELEEELKTRALVELDEQAMQEEMSGAVKLALDTMALLRKTRASEIRP